ncbi:hypothetical protein GBF38_019086, partial [Nibea albiflora]
ALLTSTRRPINISYVMTGYIMGFCGNASQPSPSRAGSGRLGKHNGSVPFTDT